MLLSEIIKVWDIIHVLNVGELGFCDLEKAISEVVKVENDCLNLNEIAKRLKNK